MWNMYTYNPNCSTTSFNKINSNTSISSTKTLERNLKNPTNGSRNAGTEKIKTIGTPASYTHVSLWSGGRQYMYHPYIIYLIRSVLSWRTRDMQAGHNSNNFEIVCICRLKRMQPLSAVVVGLSVSFAPFTRILPYGSVHVAKDSRRILWLSGYSDSHTCRRLFSAQ